MATPILSSAVAEVTVTPGPRRAYRLLGGILVLALAVSGAPSPLYAVYADQWGFSPLMLTVVFAVYAVAALAAILVTGPLIDAYGRKPALLLGASGMLAGLVLFVVADGVVWLVLARAVHGIAVGTTVVSIGAAQLDLRPDHGARTGWLTGIEVAAGMGLGVLGSALIVSYLPHPMVTPYAVLLGLVTVALVVLVLLAEPHPGRNPSRHWRIVRPRVPATITTDFRFAVIGASASWAVVGMYLSLYPQLAAQETGVHRIVFTSGVAAVAMLSAAAAQWLVRGDPRRSAFVGDVGMAVGLAASIVLVRSGNAVAVLGSAVMLGVFFGLAFNGSLRYLTRVVPAGHRGATMAAFYVCTYGTMALSTVVAGAADTFIALPLVYTYFAVAVALLCVLAGLIGWRQAAAGGRMAGALDPRPCVCCSGDWPD